MTTQHPATFGDIIRRRRCEMGLSQEELAERSGLSVRRIGDFECGTATRPHRDTMRLLSEVLNLLARSEPTSSWQPARRV